MGDYMKNVTDINIIHTLSDGTEIQDMKNFIIPVNHPIYDFWASVIKNSLEYQQAKKGA